MKGAYDTVVSSPAVVQPVLPLQAYPVFAQPTNNGFFGLSQMQDFVTLVVEPYAKGDARTALILDFSLVKVWDIASLLWLAVALHHYKHSVGLSFWLRLPEGNSTVSLKERDDFDKSADYLRRWAFDVALRNISPDVDTLLVPEQKGFFASKGPKRFYQDRKIEDEQRVLQSLISRKLVEIRNLAEPASDGGQRVSASRISECVRQFQSERIGDILAAQCGIEKRKADLFSDHLLTEALLNVKEHPNATVGLVAISLMGNTNELVLSVADNGDSIPRTIYPRFRADHREAGKDFVDKVRDYRRADLSVAERAEVAHHATKRGVTSKTGAEAINAGNGLTYIKDDSLDTFRGKLWIYTDGVCLKYSQQARDNPEVDEWPFSWRGNLLRIAIPLSKKA